MPGIYDLIDAVRDHPDYRFGVIFTADDVCVTLSPDELRTLEQVTTAAGFEYMDHCLALRDCS